MPQVITSILKRLGITVIVEDAPLTDEEWDHMRVLPIYEEQQPDEEDLIDAESIQSFMRGEIDSDQLLK